MVGVRSVYLAHCLQVKNVALYISEMQRSFTDKLSKNFSTSRHRCARVHAVPHCVGDYGTAQHHIHWQSTFKTKSCPPW